MELKRYAKILLRRWWLIVIPAAIVLTAGLATYKPAPPVYNVGMRFIVGQRPAPDAKSEDEERLANWQTSEYLVNGITDWVRGNRFAEAVSAEMASQGVNVPAGAIMGSLAADNVRSMLQLSLTYGDADVLAAMVEAVVKVMQTQNSEALPQLGGETAVIVPLDDPVINPISAGLRSQLDLPLRAAIALAAGFGLALLAEYLDPTIRDREDVQSLGLPLLGEIPRK
ncbi:MAG: hypothetical protein Kow0080_03510 [Candidatus Promineifilaceae bacterium]